MYNETHEIWHQNTAAGQQLSFTTVDHRSYVNKALKSKYTERTLCDIASDVLQDKHKNQTATSSKTYLAPWHSWTKKGA